MRLTLPLDVQEQALLESLNYYAFQQLVFVHLSVATRRDYVQQILDLNPQILLTLEEPAPQSFYRIQVLGSVLPMRGDVIGVSGAWEEEPVRIPGPLASTYQDYRNCMSLNGIEVIRVTPTVGDPLFTATQAGLQDRTWDFWIWYGGQFSNGAMVLFGQYNNFTTASGGYLCTINAPSAGRIQFRCGLSGSPSVSSTSRLDNSRWHRVTIQMDRGVGLALYIDGLLEATTATTDTTTNLNAFRYLNIFGGMVGTASSDPDPDVARFVGYAAMWAQFPYIVPMSVLSETYVPWTCLAEVLAVDQVAYEGYAEYTVELRES